MKYKILVFSFLSLFFLGACSPIDQLPVDDHGQPVPNPCPPGTVYAGSSYNFNGINLKRQYTNCESGFSICFIDGNWSPTCNPARFNNQTNPNNFKLLAEKLNNGKIKISFPKILENSTHTREELQKFVLDKPYTMYWGGVETLVLEAGTYSVLDSNNELQVTIPFKRKN